VSIVRVLSSRSPYQRGGLSFDSACKRSADGRALVELSAVEARALGDENFRELVSDPAISLEFSDRHAAAASKAPPARKAKPKSKARPKAPAKSGPKIKPEPKTVAPETKAET
jgi:hypothetical protein